MEVISYSDLRKDLANMLDRVQQDHIPILITRQNSKPAVLISLDDFNAYEETAYLLKSPKNAERLRQSIAEAEAGFTQARTLIDE